MDKLAELKSFSGKPDSFWCRYKGIPRLVSPAVCKWHRDLNDIECNDCHRASKDERTGFYDE
ncbi:MAG: hypothetical protein H8D67_05745 [Deltaproteobacteria bacterium]|nr:hypothetical protein [Deltaproteobacteria bacterium]